MLEKIKMLHEHLEVERRHFEVSSVLLSLKSAKYLVVLTTYMVVKNILLRIYYTKYYGLWIRTYNTSFILNPAG